jgi:hypothetical protein
MRLARIVAAAVLAAFLVAIPVQAAKPQASCTVSAAPGGHLLVQAVGLRRGDYWAWWSVAHVDDGTPFYYAGTSVHPSDGKTWTALVPDFGRLGYVYMYVVPESAYGPFVPVNAAAVCETVTLA